MGPDAAGGSGLRNLTRVGAFTGLITIRQPQHESIGIEFIPKEETDVRKHCNHTLTARDSNGKALNEGESAVYYCGA